MANKQRPSPLIVVKAFRHDRAFLRYAETTQRRYQRWFGFSLPLPTIILLPRRQLVRDFWRSKKETWKSGWYRNRTVYIVDLPIAKRSRADWYRLLAHELAHPFIHQASHGRVPRWLNEGLASWLAGQRHHRCTPAEAVGFFRQRKSPSNINVYQAGRMMTEYLLGKYGRQKMLNFLRQTSKARTVSSAFRKTFGMTWPTNMRLYLRTQKE